MNATEIKNQLAQCTGTTKYHRINPFYRKTVLSDGVATMADICKADWLASDICMYATELAKKHEDARYFQTWELTVKDGKGVLVGGDGNGKVYESHEYSYTDFPLDEITLWVEPSYMESEGHLLVVLLPNEH